MPPAGVVYQPERQCAEAGGNNGATYGHMDFADICGMIETFQETIFIYRNSRNHCN